MVLDTLSVFLWTALIAPVGGAMYACTRIWPVGRFKPPPEPQVVPRPVYASLRRDSGGPRRVVAPRRIKAFLCELMRDRSAVDRERAAAAQILLRSDFDRAFEPAVGIIRSAREAAWLRKELLERLMEKPSARAIPILLECLRSRSAGIAQAAEAGLKRFALGDLHLRVKLGLVRSIRASRFPWRYLRQLKLLIVIMRLSPDIEAMLEVLSVLRRVLRQRPFDTPHAQAAAAYALEAVMDLAPTEWAREELQDILREEVNRMVLEVPYEHSDLIRYRIVLALNRHGTRACLSELAYIKTHDIVESIREAADETSAAIRLRSLRPLFDSPS